MKRTYQPNTRKKLKVHGFRNRMSTRSGRLILKRRRKKGRKRLTVSGQECNYTNLKNETLKSNNEFKRVFLSGDKRIGKYVILYFLPVERNINRYGIITKKYIGNAVKRNRIKRILREILRNKYSNLLSGYDIVILARKNIINASFKEIEEDIVKLINKL